MDTLSLVERLDDLVQGAKRVPMTDEVRVDREQLFQLIDEMRAAIPEEVKQARWIVRGRQEMLAEAKRECDRLLSDARDEARRLTSASEVAKIAERDGQQTLQEARTEARRIRREIDEWAESILVTLDANLTKFRDAVRRGRERFDERSSRESALARERQDEDGGAH